MSERIKKLLTIIISLVIIIFAFLFIFLEKKDFSNNENRYLQSFPSFNISNLIDGSYIEDFESFLQDHFPFRDFLIGCKTSFYQLIGHDKVNEVYFGENNYLIEEFKNDENKDRIISILNNFSEKNDIDINFLLAPTSYEIYSNYLPSLIVGKSEKEVFKYYEDNLEFPVISLFSSFEKEKDNYSLYYKTDHHWTSYGAYFAYKEFRKFKDLSYHEIDEYKIEKVSDNFLGTLYSKTLAFSYEKDSIYRFELEDLDYVVHYQNKDSNSFYEDKYLNTKDKYSYFLDNNHPLITIENKKLKKSNNILIIKDSYANSMIPFLLPHYQTIHVIDPRYYKQSITEYIEDNKIDEVLFIYNILTLDTDLGIISVR